MLNREAIKDIVKLSRYVDISHVSFSKLDECYFYHVDGTDYVIANEDYGGKVVWGVFEMALTQNKRETVNMGMREVTKLDDEWVEDLPILILRDTIERIEKVCKTFHDIPIEFTDEDKEWLEQYMKRHFDESELDDDTLKKIRKVLRIAKGVSKWKIEASQ